MPAERGKPDSRGLNFFDITDFSPGIYDNSVIVSGTPNAPFGVTPAPPGAADVVATFGCIAEPNGGLGPLPALGGAPGSTGLAMDECGTGFPLSGPADVTAVANTFQGEGDELVFLITYDANLVAGTQLTGGWSYQVEQNVLNGIAGINTGGGFGMTYNYVLRKKNYCAYPFMTLILAQPVLVLDLAVPSGPNPNLFVYPDLGTPTVYSAGIITSASTGTGVSFGHQGRIVVIGELSYLWPAPVTIFPNENFNYTDPPLTITWPGQNETFGPEEPFGYGAFSSVSAGELFCVKRRGGAIIIQGDLNNPTITSLPGVKSTGPLYGRADSDQNGMYYCSSLEGAWVWDGGNTSTKISNQLDDNFFEVNNGIQQSTYYGYYCQRWESWMLFSNNWIYNSTSGSWWRLEDPSVRSYFWYVSAWTTPFMFAVLPTVTDTTEKFLFEYDKRTARSSFTWQSLPIKLPAEDRTTSVRELVIRASNPYADAAPQIIASLIDDDGNSQTLDTWTMETGTDIVQETRLNAGTKQTTTIAVHLAASGTDFAPVVHALSIGYRPREHVGLT